MTASPDQPGLPLSQLRPPGLDRLPEVTAALAARTTARRDGDGWSLTGRKIFSTGAEGLRWMAVWAQTDETPARVGSFLAARTRRASASSRPGITWGCGPAAVTT
jgi:alkylation response protein AidB-like acyl-CoA dehydrogenase